MIIRILSILATVAALGAVSTPSFAADDAVTTPNESAVEAVSPDAARRCEPWMHDRNCYRPLPRPDYRRNFECFARNSLGRTFVAYGNWRTPRYFVQERALQQCRAYSLPFIRATCRMVGCR